MILVISIYRALYFVAQFTARILLKSLPQKLKESIEIRDVKTTVPDLRGEVHWFHAASGEIEYVKALIRDLKKMKPEISIVVSYTSPSAAKLFDNIKSHVDHFFPLPWDQPTSLKPLIEKIKPQRVYFARTDLWPELIYQLSQHKVKMYIISYNPTFTTTNILWSKIFLPLFSGIFCTHPDQEAKLKKIVPSTVLIATPGDTRFDQVFWRLQQPTKIPFQMTKPYLVFGSSWAEDETQFVPLLGELKTMGYQIVWSPHEVNLQNIERIQNILKEMQLSFVKFSELNSVDCDVLILDKVGYLADFYRLAEAAFVGGSFKSKVHSVMEPLCCAIPVVTGPRIGNSPEAQRYHQIIMNDLRVVQVAKNSQELLAAFKNIQSAPRADFKRLLIGNLEKNRHATRRITDLLFG